MPNFTQIMKQTSKQTFHSEKTWKQRLLLRFDFTFSNPGEEKWNNTAARRLRCKDQEKEGLRVFLSSKSFYFSWKLVGNVVQREAQSEVYYHGVFV